MEHLKVGDPIVVGNTFGRVRAMVNDLGRRVKEAGPSTPVEITGLMMYHKQEIVSLSLKTKKQHVKLVKLVHDDSTCKHNVVKKHV